MNTKQFRNVLEAQKLVSHASRILKEAARDMNNVGPEAQDLREFSHKLDAFLMSVEGTEQSGLMAWTLKHSQKAARK